MCKDGRIWGQNNKLAGEHLGISTKKVCTKKGFNYTKSVGRKFKKGVQMRLGETCSEETKRKISESRKGKRCGKNHPNWKGGITRTTAWFTERTRLYRKKYPEKAKYHAKLYKYRKKNAGEITIKIIQEVYEDNIKRYGCLTCIYCLEGIMFGKDHLEHKQPLSRGGTNHKNNLAISCSKCNLKKNNKTYKEFMKGGNKMAGKDKVIHPVNKSAGGNVAKDSNIGKISGPKPAMNNLTPFNRKKG